MKRKHALTLASILGSTMLIGVVGINKLNSNSYDFNEKTSSYGDLEISLVCSDEIKLERLRIKEPNQKGGFDYATAYFDKKTGDLRQIEPHYLRGVLITNPTLISVKGEAGTLDDFMRERYLSLKSTSKE